MWQDLAFSGLSTRCVCLCLDRLELVAKYFPHSTHWYFGLKKLFAFDLPSVFWRESNVKDFGNVSGIDMSEECEDTGDIDGV